MGWTDVPVGVTIPLCDPGEQLRSIGGAVAGSWLTSDEPRPLPPGTVDSWLEADTTLLSGSVSGSQAFPGPTSRRPSRAGHSIGSSSSESQGRRKKTKASASSAPKKRLVVDSDDEQDELEGAGGIEVGAHGEAAMKGVEGEVGGDPPEEKGYEGEEEDNAAEEDNENSDGDDMSEKTAVTAWELAHKRKPNRIYKLKVGLFLDSRRSLYDPDEEHDSYYFSASERKWRVWVGESQDGKGVWRDATEGEWTKAWLELKRAE